MRCEFLLPLKEAQRVDILSSHVLGKGVFREVTSKTRKAISEQKQPNNIGGMMVDGIKFFEEKRILLVK